MQEARRWFVLLQDRAESGGADHIGDAAMQARFAAWLEETPAHRAAWLRTQQLWTRLDTVVPVLRQRRLPAPVSRRVWLQRVSAAAAIAAVGCYAVTHPALFADYRNARAERRQVTLADGSVIELGSDTAISVTLGKTVRRITLYDGDAFFTVASDAGRPFVVEAAGGEITALGTAFDVKRRGSDVTVAVTEHAVSVHTDGGRLTVAAGEQVSYGAPGLGLVQPADLAAVQAWRHDRLFFHETPLRDAVAEIQRYRVGRIIITDDAIGAIPVTGMFHTTETEAALQTIADTLPVRLTRATDLLTLIQPK